jgi:hypothetical protein
MSAFDISENDVLVEERPMLSEENEIAAAAEHADDEGEDADVDAEADAEADADADAAPEETSFYTESRFTLTVKNEKGQTLTFTVFDEDEKKVHLELSEPMTLPLEALKGYVNELDDVQPPPTPGAVPISIIVGILISLFIYFVSAALARNSS